MNYLIPVFLILSLLGHAAFAAANPPTRSGVSSKPSSGGVPSGFPFPAGAQPQIKPAGPHRSIATFTFKGDAGEVYDRIKSWAENNGYQITMENRDNYRLAATGTPPLGFVLNIVVTSKANVGTVTFSGLGN